jgi:hypothetical protein
MIQMNSLIQEKDVSQSRKRWKASKMDWNQLIWLNKSINYAESSKLLKFHSFSLNQQWNPKSQERENCSQAISTMFLRAIQLL